MRKVNNLYSIKRNKRQGSVQQRSERVDLLYYDFKWENKYPLVVKKMRIA